MLSGYTLYGDAAGGKDHGFIVVSGYLATVDQWSEFIHDWRLLLAMYDVPYFHMKEFSQSKGPFTSWKDDEPKRKRFLSKAAEIIRSRVEYGLSCIVEYETFLKVNLSFRLDGAVGNPYSLAARDCVAHSYTYLFEKGYVDPEITYIFEDGDQGKGEFKRVMKKDGHHEPIFRPSRDRENGGVISRGSVPLQAADFAAYEIRKVFKDDPAEVWPIHRYRKSLAALSRVNSWWGRYSEQNLLQMCEVASIPSRGIANGNPPPAPA